MISKIEKNDLKIQYEQVCNEYIQLFCAKQEMNFEGWASEIVGGVAFCDDYFFSLIDIIWDVTSNQAKGDIVDWYHENMDIDEKSISYFSYTKGMRVSDLE